MTQLEDGPALGGFVGGVSGGIMGLIALGLIGLSSQQPQSYVRPRPILSKVAIGMSAATVLFVTSFILLVEAIVRGASRCGEAH